MKLQPGLNLPKGDFYGSEIAKKKKSFGEIKMDAKKTNVGTEYYEWGKHSSDNLVSEEFYEKYLRSC